MPRPTEVARTGTWTLVQVAAEAAVTRAMARSAVERGLLPKGGYTEADVVLARVAGALLAFPDPTALPGRGKPDSARRDATAIRFARAALTDPATTYDTCLVVSGAEVEVANTPEQAAAILQRMPAVATLVLPVGRWRAMLPSVQRRSPAHPATTLRLVKPATGFAAYTAAKATLVPVPTEPPADIADLDDPFALPEPAEPLHPGTDPGLQS